MAEPRAGAPSRSAAGDGRVLLVGAGVAGLAAAIALERVGVEAVVLEREPRVPEVGAGLALGPNAITALRRIGIAEAVEAAGEVLWRLQHRRDDGRVIADWPTGRVSRKVGAPIVALGRAELMGLLAERAPAGSVRLGAECVGLEERDGTVAARLADGGEERGAILVGSDGIGSAIRARFDSTPLRSAGFTEWRGVCAFDGAEPGVHVQSYGRGLVFGWVPVAGGRVAWYGRANAAPGGSDEPGEAQPKLLAMFGGWHEPVAEVIRATAPGAITRADVFDLPRRRRWASGRTTLMGDAAHPTTPTLGQGASMAIEDAAVLARCVSEHGPAVAAIEAYEALRIPRRARIVATSRRQGAMERWRRPVACRLRSRLIASLPIALAARQFEKVVRFEV